MLISERSTGLKPDAVGAPSIAGFALNAAAPMMVVGAYVTTAWAVTGVVPVALALVGMGALLALWCVGYLAMARHVVNAGSLYTYLAHGIGPWAATAGAAVQLLAYSLLQVGLYGIAGVQAAALLNGPVGLALPWWVWAVLAWALVLILGTRGVGVSSRLLAAAIVVEIVLITVITAVDLTHPAGGHISTAALDPGGLTTGSLGAVIAIAVTAYVGIEAAPVYSEEARQPQTTIMRATYLALGLMVATYVFGSWAMSVVVGPDQVIDTARQLGPDMLLVPASTHLGGSILVDLGHVLLLTSILAGLISYHNSVARCGFALARDGVLPGWLSWTNPRTGAPVAASLTQSATGLAVILLFAIGGWDPLTRLFFWGGTTGALGVLILMVAASAAALGFFRRSRRGEGRWATQIAPALATGALGVCLLLVVANFANLLGVAPSHPARWMLPAGYLLAAGAGLGYAAWLRARRPHALAGIGRGANAISSSLAWEVA
ncbi:MAG: APC family permease [Micromonosporaceae bacterium]|nr:APC family permease [Micromonosporaceae bacterium]